MISNADAENLVRALSQDSMFAPFFNGIQITDINGFLQRISNQDGRIHCREIYQRCIRRYSANEYSMPVYSGHVMNAPMHIDCFIDYSCDERCETPCHIHCFNHCHPHCHICCDMDCCAPHPDSGSLANCLYTGDFNASSQNPYYNSMVQFYHHNHRWERIKMIQVPHHGSKHSHNIDLYQERCFAFISCGLHNQYHHPHAECVAGIITTGCHCSIVNEYCQPLKIEMHIH